jgi:hypothetical protein
MTQSNNGLPQPGSKLLRTWLSWPRNIKPLARPIALAEVCPEPPDPDELAHWGRVELLDDNLVVLHRDGTRTYRTHYIAALHGAEDLREWEEFNVVYRRRLRRPKVIRSVLRLPDGSVKKAKVLDRQIDAAGNRLITGTHTHLRPGVILDHEIQDDHFKRDPIGAAAWGEFFLRTRWPCVRRRLTVAIAKPFELLVKLHHGASEPVPSQHGRYRVYQWELSNTEGVEVDHWTPPPRDFCPWIDYSTLPSWRPLTDYYLKELDPDHVKGFVIDGKSMEIVKDAATDEQRLTKVYCHVARDVRYGRPAREMENRIVRSGMRMAEDLQGDCKDKSALMVAMLRKMNIAAHVAAVVTRQHGGGPFLPGPRFDHAVVLAEVGGKNYWLDAAAGPFSMGVIPHDDQGAVALLVREGQAEFQLVPPAQPSDHGLCRRCTATLDEDGTYRYSVRGEYIGEQAAMMRARLLDRTDEFCARLIQQMEAEVVPGAQVTNVAFDGIEDLTGNVVVRCDVTLPRLARRIKDLILLRVPWSDPLEERGPLAAAERKIPLIPPPTSFTDEEHEITLPDGYAAYGLPYHCPETCAWSTYQCSVEQRGGVLVCRRVLQHGSVEKTIPTERFAEFKRYWSACSKSDTVDVVLFKGGELKT